MDTFLNLENVTFKYSDDCEDTLKNISLKVNKGEFLAILGHNASGKSTLAKHFNALLLPYGGKVYVSGMDTLNEGELYEIRRMVGLVLQNPDNQIVASVVEEDVAFGPENLGVVSAEIRSRVDKALKCVDMYELKNKTTYKLSGGQKQKLAIAGVLAMHPECIVLDEPTAMLDPVGRQEVMWALTKLNKENGITIILITHYMDEAIEADRVVVMDKGEIILDDAPKEVFSQVDAIYKSGLTVPQTTELIYNLNKQGFNLPLGILSTKECVLVLEKFLEDNKCR